MLFSCVGGLAAGAQRGWCLIHIAHPHSPPCPWPPVQGCEGCTGTQSFAPRISWHSQPGGVGFQRSAHACTQESPVGGFMNSEAGPPPLSLQGGAEVWMGTFSFLGGGCQV